MYLENKVAIVTGGAKGMGRGIALKFAEEGANVVLCDLDYAGLPERGRARSRPSGGEALAFKIDITKSAEIERMVAGTLEEFGTIDILINCAGGVPGTHGAGATGTMSEAGVGQGARDQPQGPLAGDRSRAADHEGEAVRQDRLHLVHGGRVAGGVGAPLPRGQGRRDRSRRSIWPSSWRRSTSA